MKIVTDKKEIESQLAMGHSVFTHISGRIVRLVPRKDRTTIYTGWYSGLRILRNPDGSFRQEIR